MSVLVNNEAPDFIAPAAMPNGVINEERLSEFRRTYVVLFFWPMHFTFVCPTEIIAHVAMRGSFLIDREGIVQHQLVNNLALGRGVSEMLRIVDALQYCEKHAEACPAGWHAGEEAIKPGAKGVAEYLGKHEKEL